MRLLLSFALAAAAAFGLDDRQASLEIAMGKSMAAELEKQYRILADDEVQSEVIRIGQKLVGLLPADEFPYVFKVVVGESAPPMNEPWPFPGGFVYVPSGLILRAQSEGELAGMLAHSITHVAQRHGAQVKGKGAFPGGVPWAWNPNGLYPKEVAAQWLEFEIAADMEGARLMSRAGYDPAALASYLERNNASADRVKMLRDSIRGIPPGTFASNEYEFTNLQATVRQFSTVGDKPKPPSLRNPARR